MTYVLVRSFIKGAANVRSGKAADHAITAVSSLKPYSDRLTSDALITAIGDLHGTIIGFHGTVRMMADELDRDRDERRFREDLQQEHNLNDLRNIVRSMRRDRERR